MPKTEAPRTRQGGNRPTLSPLPAFLDLRPTFEVFLALKGRSAVTVKGHCDAMRRITSQLETTHPTTVSLDRFVVDLYRSQLSYSHKVNTVQANRVLARVHRAAAPVRPAEETAPLDQATAHRDGH